MFADPDIRMALAQEITKARAAQPVRRELLLEPLERVDIAGMGRTQVHVLSGTVQAVAFRRKVNFSPNNAGR